MTAAQRAGDLDPAADPHGLAAHLLVVLRGIEAIGKAGADAATLTAAADTALACLPAPPGSLTGPVPPRSSTLPSRTSSVHRRRS